MFISKSKTLQEIENKIDNAIVLPQIAFSYEKYVENPSAIISEISNKGWDKRSLIVRSSDENEDGSENSNAGKFLSIGNINGKDSLEDAIKSVFKSMGMEKHKMVFIQPYLENVDISGVVFTLDPNTGGNYFVINYDDNTGRTDTVTNGTGEDLKTLYIFKTRNFVYEKREFEKLVELCFELEDYFESNTLDIEFAIRDGIIYLLQVRPLTIGTANKSISEQEKVLDNIGEQIKKRRMTQHPDILGSYSIYGIMPDWNPAEMIGTHPRNLALSLYKEIITDSVWAYQRDNYGYRNMRSFPLMIDFCGIPYIDTRISFNSFIPKKLDSSVADKLVEFYLNRLRSHPEFHDKIEFNIVYSCYTINTEKEIEELLDNGFSAQECESIIVSLRDLTNNILNEDYLEKDLKKIDILKQKCSNVENSELSKLDKIYWLLEYCKRYGTLPFAGIARAGFIAMEFLDSLVQTHIISEDDKEKYMNSLSTVGKKIIIDARELDENNFNKKYGHLRPGTYDICEPCYASSDIYQNIGKNRVDADRLCVEFNFTDNQITEIQKQLKVHRFDIDVCEYITFIKTAIEGREFAKFEFTRVLSEVIELIAEIGAEYGFSRQDMSYMNIHTFLDLYAKTDYNIKELIENSICIGRDVEEKASPIVLPYLLWSEKQVFCFQQKRDEPNFITKKKCEAEIVELPSDKDIDGKIVIVRNADPGYDWIFSHNIIGFITAFGGANSHMAIRCAEFGIPAAIGVGLKSFERYKKCARLRLDCTNRKVVELN
jgi:phosphohistidine swiveling domain-containing protein